MSSSRWKASTCASNTPGERAWTADMHYTLLSTIYRAHTVVHPKSTPPTVFTTVRNAVQYNNSSSGTERTCGVASGRDCSLPISPSVRLAISFFQPKAPGTSATRFFRPQASKMARLHGLLFVCFVVRDGRAGYGVEWCGLKNHCKELENAAQPFFGPITTVAQTINN